MEQKKRILIVDDNPSVHEDIKQVLLGNRTLDQSKLMDLEKELFGDTPAVSGVPVPQYSIDSAMQGEIAFAKVDTAANENNPYAMIFMDVRMPPGIDGIETIKRIWAKHPEIEMVICTAYSDHSWDEIILQLGVSDKLLFLRKPFDAVGIKQVALALTTKWELHRRVAAQVQDLEQKVSERTEELNKLLVEKETTLKMLQEDLQLASSVQKFLLPASIPQFQMMEVAAEYIPATQVGGDLYDILQLDHKHIGILILDVSGHGLAAAMVTAMCKYLFSANIHMNSPAEMFSRLNTDLKIGTPEIFFVSAFLIIIDTETLKAVYCNAGHPAPILLRAKTGELEELGSTGLILGISDAVEYQEVEIQLELDDKLILYTDGITEAINTKKVLFGRKRLKEIIQTEGRMGLDELLHRIIRKYKEYIYPGIDRDDICLVGCKIINSPFADIIRNILKADLRLNESSVGFNFIRIHKEMEIDRITGLILKELDRNGYGDKTIKGIRIAITEVLLNAVRHGNCNDESKTISLAFQISSDKIIIGIMDEGQGFDYQKLTLPAGPEELHGRGILITKHYVDSITFHGPGNCVILICYRKTN